MINNNAYVTWKTPYHYLEYIPAPSHYCIDIFKANGIAASMHLLSNCNLQNTTFVYNYEENEIEECYFLTYSITPINSVGNGTVTTIIQEHDFSSGKYNKTFGKIFL